MNLMSLLLTLIFSGGGHLLFRKEIQGLVLAIPFYIMLTLAILIHTGQLLFPISAEALICGSAVIWLFALFDICRLILRRKSNKWQSSRDAAFSIGFHAILKKELSVAQRCMQETLQSDPGDADAWHYLNFIYEKQGRLREAQKAGKNCRYFDMNGKWSE